MGIELLVPNIIIGPFIFWLLVFYLRQSSSTENKSRNMSNGEDDKDDTDLIIKAHEVIRLITESFIVSRLLHY